MPTKKDWVKIIGIYLIIDALISLAWGLSGDCLQCLNNSQLGNYVRILRLISGIYLVRL